MDVEEILKRGFVNVPEKYIYVEQNLSKKISVLENAGSTKAAALMQMIIEEIQLRQANYRYTVSTLAFNLVLFFDRLDNENIKFQNNSRETSDYTRKIISYIELHYMEDIGGKDFARACNLSETHMRRIFIESANITPSEYLNLVRIKKACEMLAKEKCSIEKVSNSVGYPVISTFMRNFKKITGISPNAWRRSPWRIRKMWQPTKYQCLRGGKIYRVPPGTVKKQLPKGQTVTIPVFSARFYYV